MSVMVVSEKSLRLITVLLINTFEKDPVRTDGVFRVWRDQEKYPVLHTLVNDHAGRYHDITQILSMWNCTSYATRYPNQEIDITEDAKVIPNFDNRWYYAYNVISAMQRHKTLTCYLYQIEYDNPAIKELRKLCVEYGEWILRQSPEWESAEWE